MGMAKFRPAGAEGHIEGVVAQAVERFQMAAQPRYRFAHFILAFTLAEKHKFIAANAGQEVVALGASVLERFGHAHQGAVAGGVAVSIVDVLEAIQIHHQRE